MCGRPGPWTSAEKSLPSVFEYPAFCRTIPCRVPYKHLTDNSADNLKNPRLSRHFLYVPLRLRSRSRDATRIEGRRLSHWANLSKVLASSRWRDSKKGKRQPRVLNSRKRRSRAPGRWGRDSTACCKASRTLLSAGVGKLRTSVANCRIAVTLGGSGAGGAGGGDRSRSGSGMNFSTRRRLG